MMPCGTKTTCQLGRKHARACPNLLIRTAVRGLMNMHTPAPRASRSSETSHRHKGCTLFGRSSRSRGRYGSAVMAGPRSNQSDGPSEGCWRAHTTPLFFTGKPPGAIDPVRQEAGVRIPGELPAVYYKVLLSTGSTPGPTMKTPKLMGDSFMTSLEKS